MPNADVTCRGGHLYPRRDWSRTCRTGRISHIHAVHGVFAGAVLEHSNRELPMNSRLEPHNRHLLSRLIPSYPSFRPARSRRRLASQRAYRYSESFNQPPIQSVTFDLLSAVSKDQLPSLLHAEARLMEYTVNACAGGRPNYPACAAGYAVALALADFLSAAEEIKCMARGSMQLLLSKQLAGEGSGTGPAATSTSASATTAANVDFDADSELQSQQRLSAEALRECSRLLVSVGLAEGRVMGSQAVYSAVLAEVAAADVVSSTTGNILGESGAAPDDGGATLLPAGPRPPGTPAGVEGEQVQRLLRWLLVRLRHEGYHPSLGGASFSVILGREAKLQHLAGLR